MKRRRECRVKRLRQPVTAVRIARSCDPVLERLADGEGVVVPFGVALAEVLGNSDTEISDRDHYAPTIRESLTQDERPERVPSVIDGVTTEFRQRHVTRAPEPRHVGQAVLEQLQGVGRDLLDVGVVTDPGEGHDRKFAIGSPAPEIVVDPQIADDV